MTMSDDALVRRVATALEIADHEATHQDKQLTHEGAARAAIRVMEIAAIPPKVWTATQARIAGLERELGDARKVLGEHSKHEIGQTVAGGINNLRQILQLAKDAKTDLEQENERLHETCAKFDTFMSAAERENERLRREKEALNTMLASQGQSWERERQRVTDLEAGLRAIQAEAEIAYRDNPRHWLLARLRALLPDAG